MMTRLCSYVCALHVCVYSSTYCKDSGYTCDCYFLRSSEHFAKVQFATISITFVKATGQSNKLLRLLRLRSVSLSLSVCLFVCLSLSLCLSVFLSVCVSVCLSVCLSLSLSLWRPFAWQISTTFAAPSWDLFFKYAVMTTTMVAAYGKRL